MALPKKKVTSHDFAALLGTHSVRIGLKCATCSWSGAPKLDALMAYIESSGQPQSIATVHRVLQREYGYPYTVGALANHLQRHEPRWQSG